MKGPLANLMQQAQQMQEQMQKAQEELGQLEVIGEAGAGMVKITMSGRHEVRKVHVDRQLFADDPEMAEDLIAAAINDAVNKISTQSTDHMKGLAGGLNLPPGFKLPF